ncbi:MAG: glycosyltransferase family 2 protein [Elusimicrobia bacterium]|nr:glycosyltransferase family 2 protein [Elusimicrobiota bacterium]
MAPVFSVVIPTYNRAAPVAAAVRSVLAQTETSFECLVVDDASTDDTRRVLAGFADPRVRVFHNETNRRVAACRNRAIREARGEWIAFLDSDDLYLKGRLEALRRASLQTPSAGFLFSNAYLHRYGRIVGTLFDPAKEIPQGRVPAYYALGERWLPYVTTMVAIRRAAFEKTGLFREDFSTHEDMELYGRMLGGGLEVKALKEPLAVRFIHGGGQLTDDYHWDFQGSMDALKSFAPPADIASQLRRAVAREVAEYLWRSARPAEARAFLEKELGAVDAAFALKTRLPSWALKALREARRIWLRTRFHPALAPADYRAASAEVDALLTATRTA